MKILAALTHPDDACSWYRAVGPLAALRHESRKIAWPEEGGYRGSGSVEVIYHGEGAVPWTQMAQADVLFMNRPVNPTNIATLEQAKQFGVPIWIDYDDDVLAVPQENPHAEVYAMPQVRETIITLIKNADLITVSTQAIKDAYSKITDGAKIHVVPNAWNDYLLPFKSQDSKPQNKVVLWRGSHTHIRDLDEVAAEIIAVSDWNKEWKFVFAGFAPWRIMKELGDRAIHIPMLQLMKFYDRMHDWRPAVMMVPLTDHQFNRSKSNCAWLEANYAGAVCVGNDELEEWDSVDYPYGHGKAFGRALSDAMTAGSEARAYSHNASREYIETSRVLSVVNRQRFDLLASLVNRPK